MTPKIETIPRSGGTNIRLIGGLRAGCLPELRAQIEAGGRKVLLEMDEVTLADLGVALSLGACEALGVGIRCSSAYIRGWIA